MNKRQLRRDSLDYIITDSIPVEISELFTYTYLYEYLHTNNREVGLIVQEIADKYVNVFKKGVPFESDGPGISWKTTPLNFHIVKADGHSKRKMSIPQPLSVMNMYYFISLYQKDILNLFENPVYSVRYHRRNTDLVYKRRGRKALIDYQYSRDAKSKKAIEQAGNFFDIWKYPSVVELARSKEWKSFNLNFKRYCKLDYKRCFDSIYSHSYKWIVSKDVVDSKNFKNPSLYAVIDRMIQNINGSVSNGVIVGPEFSRMIVEVLLQQIDEEVNSELKMKSLTSGTDYEIRRFVDDIFIFSNSLEAEETIISIVEEKARKYLLEINELKSEKQNTPYFKGDWITDVERFTDLLLKYLRTDSEIQRDDETFQIKMTKKDLRKVIDEFEYLMAKHKSMQIRISNYVLSVIMNALAGKKEDYTFFKKATKTSLECLIDFTMFVYSHSVNFNNTQKLISVLYYCHQEVDLTESERLQYLVSKYESSITSRWFSDYINLFVALKELRVYLTLGSEEKVFLQILEQEDPIALATYLNYCTYNARLLSRVSERIGILLQERYNALHSGKDEMLHKEFWYVLVFNKSPYISAKMQDQYTALLKRLLKKAGTTTSGRTGALILKFMLDKDEDYAFISWNAKGARMLQEITYRTHNKTIFKRGASGLLVSL